MACAKQFKNGSYNGQLKGDQRHGRGTMSYTNGGQYDGEWHRDKMEGRGVCIWPDGYRYDGEFKADMREGRGVSRWPDGKRYDGEWKAGVSEGRGVCLWPCGKRYDGEFKAGKTEGRGECTWPDNNRYDGEWKAGKMEGRGVYTLADGRAFEGLFRGDFPVVGPMVELDGAVFRAAFDGRTPVWQWQPTTKERVGTLAGGWRDAGGSLQAREFEWAGGGGRFLGSWRGMCPLAGSLVKADGSEWAVVYDGRTTLAEGAAPVVEVPSPRRASRCPTPMSAPGVSRGP